MKGGITVQHEFEYHGGVDKPTEHSIEKFLLFFVVNGAELTMSQMLRQGLAYRKEDSDPWTFVTDFDVAKIFIMERGFGSQTRIHSFYVRFDSKSANHVTIRSFTPGQKFFRARAHFLKTSEAAALLDKDSLSLVYLMKQSPLALDTLRRMITIERIEKTKGKVRVIRTGLVKEKSGGDRK